MRSLRLFFSDEACTSGQLVVASRESQYKVFHYHHGGLDKLADVLQQWKYCAETHLRDQSVADEKTCMQFSIRRPKLPSSETHPEESMHRRLDVPAWLGHLNELGQVEEEYKLRKAIFFGGIDVSIRGEVWPFLLRYYSHDSTSEEREALRVQKRKEYAEIQQKEHRAFWRNVQFVVDKDVVRTDRSNQFFRGEGNPNVESMRCPPGPRPRPPPGSGRGLPVHTITPETEGHQLSEPTWISAYGHGVPGKPIGASQGCHKALIPWHPPSLSLLGSREP
ncbi:TBC1 domain family member 16 [Pteropus alecto]|uniref:TBC1 domain family member 16 n=1 Tax=Pteropus alecto TaxID=9402 RepID=L5KL51_PTEAL|nr:TBC1 domain family member 16 [Pteropus alecto]